MSLGLSNKNYVLSLANFFAAIILILVVVLSLSRPMVPWDSWAYHFPFSAQIFEIHNYSKSFLLDESLQIRYDGFPLLPEFIQGLLWILTKSLSATSLINSISLVVFIYVASRYGRASFPILVFGALSIPLVAVHALSTYIDLFVGVWLALQYVIAVLIYGGIDNKKSSPKLYVLYVAYICAAGIAGNSKMWAPVIGFSITSFLCAAILLKKRSELHRKVLIWLILTVFMSCLLGASTLIKNTLSYGNPIYPIRYSIPSLNLQFDGPEIEYKNYPGYADKFGIFQRPIYFALSISEYDWVIRGVEPIHKIETGVGDNPKRYSPARTGGWWGILMIANLTLLLIMLIVRFLDFRVNKIDLFPILLFCFMTILTAFMPQSHELRYFLYWPLILIFNVAYFSKNLFHTQIPSSIIVLISVGFFLYSTFILREESIQSFLEFKTQKQLIGVSPDADEILNAKKLGVLCLGPSYNPNQFKYSAVLQGGNYVIEQGWLGCKRYPEYRRP